MELKALFKLTPAAAIKYFKGKNNKLSWDWYDLWQNAHRKVIYSCKGYERRYFERYSFLLLIKHLKKAKPFKIFKKNFKPTTTKERLVGRTIYR
jgi:uncharacterized protein with gpF-like domain